MVHRQSKLIQSSSLWKRFFALSRTLSPHVKTSSTILKANYGECNLLLEYCTKGWPRQSRLLFHVKRYWQLRGDLSIWEKLLLKGVRIVVPSTLQHSIFNFIHDWHHGFFRCKAIARESVWWPGVNSHIETLVSNCAKCTETHVQLAELMMPFQTPSLPWEEVGVGLFHLKGQDYVLLVDYRSCFPEVISLCSITIPAITTAIKRVFARHSIPSVARSDNSPQFSSKDFSTFAQAYGFRQVTSSPHFPQSNGEVERMV
nr:uncharacterized protein K02A2.6-like [Dermacentor andersoni]